MKKQLSIALTGMYSYTVTKTAWSTKNHLKHRVLRIFKDAPVGSSGPVAFYTKSIKYTVPLSLICSFEGTILLSFAH